MPNVEELLADEGTSYTSFYSTLPLCCPARATLLTGQYAHNHGVLDNKPPTGGYSAFKGRESTLGVWLQEAGYRTAWVGKYLNGYGLEGDYAVPPGWSDWRVPVEETYLLMYEYLLDVDGETVEYGEEAADYQTDVLADEALALIDDALGGDDEAGEEPLFLVLSPLAPHDEADTLTDLDLKPRPAPRHLDSLPEPDLDSVESFDESDVSDKPARVRKQPRISPLQRAAFEQEIRARLGTLLAVDEAIAEIVSRLEDLGELDETVVVFTSDNGYMTGEHRLDGKGELYEESTRVPLIVRGPGFPDGAEIVAPYGNVDLVPTFLELGGAEADRELDGISLLAPPPQDRAVLLETEKGSAGLRVGEWAYYDNEDDEPELYDLAADPFQLENLADDAERAELVGELDARLEELRDCSGSDCL
jgi:arylsulfatase A-like enzyme